MISDADKLEQDREHMTEFEAGIEADLAEAQSASRRCALRWGAWIGVFLICGAIALLFPDRGYVQGVTLVARVFVAIFGVFAGIFLAPSGDLRTKVRRLRSRAADRLRGANRGFLVGVLAAYCASNQPGLSAAAHDGLKRCLGDVRPEHREILHGSGLRSLLHVLRDLRDPELLLLLIDGLSRLGDPDALPAVQRVAENPDHFLNHLADAGFVDRLRNAASACAEVLKARAEDERIRGSLLRPAGSPFSETDLLRPARGGAAVEENLLRSSDQDEIAQTVHGADS